MLLFDSAVDAAGVTVYRDHAAAGTFYYLPGAPRVVVGEAGAPGLSLTRYRGAREGGLLTLEVDLALTDGALDAARAALSRGSGAAVNLVPVPFCEGTVRLAALGVTAPTAPAPTATAATTPATATAVGGGVGRLIERVIGTAAPSLFGRQRASFSLALDAEAATLLAAAIAGDGAPVVVSYELGFDALRPARGVRARVSYRMAYDYLRTRLQADALIFHADLDRESEALQREGHVTVEDVDYTGSDPATLAQRRDQIVATLRELSEQLFFRPAVSPLALGGAALAAASDVGAAWAQGGRPQIAFALRDLEQHEEQTLAYDLVEATVARCRIAPQGALRCPDGVHPLHEVTTDGEPGPQTVRAFTAPDARWDGVGAITVDLRVGDELRSLSLTPQAPSLSATLPPGPIGARISVAAVIESDALGQPPAPDPTFRPLDRLNLLVDPAGLAARRTVEIALGVVDPTLVSGARGRLSLAGQVRDLLLDTAHPSTVVPVWGGAEVALHTELLLADGAPLAADRTVGVAEQVVLVNQPASLFQVVGLTLQDPLARYDTVMVEIAASDGAPARSFALSAAAPSASWSARRGPAGRGFRYRVRKVGKDARVTEVDWSDGNGSLLVVGDLDTRVAEIEVVLLGGADALGALLRVTSLAPPPDTDATVETMLDPGQLELRVRLAFAAGAPLHYRVEGKLLYGDGERPFGPLEDSGEVVLVPIPSGSA